MGRPRIYDEALRERLIDQADQMMAKDGYHGVSLRVLTREAGTSTNAVYTLFGSKEALMAEVVVRNLDEALGDNPVQDDSDDPEKDLLHVATRYRDYAVDNPNSFDGAFEALSEAKRPGSLTERINPEVRDLDKKLFEPIFDVCNSIAAQNPGRNLSPEKMAIAVWAIIHGFAVLEKAHVLPSDPEQNDTIFDEAVKSTYMGWLARNVEELHEEFEAE